MWETTVLVEQEQPVDAVPEKIWALAGSVTALSAMPAWFAYSIPSAVAGTDRLCCLVAVGSLMTCAVLDVREEIPGQLICWQTRSTHPAGRQLFTLSLLPRRHGATVRLSVSHVVPRPSQIKAEAYWRAETGTWVGRLKAIAEGRAPWPQAGMPPDMQQACLSPPPLKSPRQASATALISAPASAVWEAVWAPESAVFADPGHVACAGHVPGTPQRQAGEMQYTVMRRPGDRFTAAVHVVKEVTEYKAVTQNIQPPHGEILHLITPTPEGTRLELTYRWLVRERGNTRKNVTATVAGHLQAMADGYKALIEESSRDS
jgi:hypothetical protein